MDILQSTEHFLSIAKTFFLPFLHCSGDNKQKTSAEFQLVACDGPDAFQRMAGLLTGNSIIQCCTDAIDIRSLANCTIPTGIRCLRRCHGSICIASRGCRVSIGNCISVSTQWHRFGQWNRFSRIRHQMHSFRACVLLRCRITRRCTNRQHSLGKNQRGVKIDHADVPGRCNHNIAGLNITMQDRRDL